MGSIVDELQFRQGELAELCKKPIPSLREMTWINHQYGIGTLFRQYASLPEDQPLAFSIDHGVPLHPKGGTVDSDFVSGLPAFLNAYPERAEHYRQLGMPRVEVSALAIHYARSVLKRDRGWKEPERRFGTIAFPHKSAARTDRSFDFDSYAQWLVHLPEQYQPVCVCIFWKDYLKDRHLPYLKIGIPVVTCGHFYDPEFLPRFIDLCSRFKYACSNSIASSFPLSVICGCHFFHKNVGAIQETEVSKGDYEVVNPGEDTFYGGKLKTLAPFPPVPAQLTEQRTLSEFLTGADHILPSDKIQEMQSWGRQWLLGRQGDRMSFAVKADLKELNTWLPKNMYPDGYASAQSGLILKPRMGETVFKAYIKFSKGVSTKTQPLTCSVGDNVTWEFQCAPALYELTLPLPPSQACPITFHFPHEIDQSGQGHRRVAFRFLGWQITKATSGEAHCRRVRRWERLPSFLCVPNKDNRGIRRWLGFLTAKRP